MNRGAAVSLACTLLVAPLASQVGDQQPPVFRRAINLVMVDAHPTAKDRPVADLTQEDFEILEDGVPQTVATFELKTFRAPVPEPLRAEPRTVAESDRMAADPRSRVFVLYLDTYHLPGLLNEGVNQYPARDAVRTWMRSLLGEDDIVGFLTPELDALTMTFTRRTFAIDEFLRERWMREIRVDDYDPTERMYQTCYARWEWVEKAMIARKRERQVLKTLLELVNRLGDLREDRKAVLLVGGGWTVFRPSPKLAAPLENRPLPGSGRIGVGPTGRLGVGRADDQLQGAFEECERDRLMLANIDNERDFRSLAGAANRVNVSVYAVDPRGLVAPGMVRGKPLDMDALDARRSMLYELASATDGLAVIDTNDFERGMQRIVEDMSSYYLLGYYSTNTKLDGRFRKITVRVKRPGVSVRARNGYQAPTEAEMAPPPRPAPGAAAAPKNARAEALAQALAGVNRLDRGREVVPGVAWSFVGPVDASGGQPLLWRRGASTGPGYVPTNDVRFRRVERLRVDVPTPASLDAMAATLLDRAGKPLSVPVTLGEREEGGVRYVTGEVVLAPLALGDYIVEVSHRAMSPPASVLVAFRIVP